MEFQRKNTPDAEDRPNSNIQIGDTSLTHVTETKFLGVIIDDRLSWEPHIKMLTKKLASCTGSLNRIKDNIPEHLHIDLYHTLFESHLAYGIMVWGGVSPNKLQSLITAQKRCIGIMFGDKEAYLDKFKTCVRARPVESQILTSEFFTKEHSKPLFVKHEILSLQNLYFYHCANETFKILKYRSPTSMLSEFTISKRPSKDTLLITPWPSDTFIYKAAVVWNMVRQMLSITDTSTPIGSFKTRLKALIRTQQAKGDGWEWEDRNNMNTLLG